MKTRVLSLLLLLAMLITMFPVMGVSAAATENSGDEPSRNDAATSTPVSDYYSLYKTENLIAFFDALDPTNGTLDLAAGKWYARVYNADTAQFEISTKIFATIKGGVYNADENPTGWQAYESGFGFTDPDFTVTDNAVVFDYTKLLQNGPTRYNNWTVENVVKVDLRTVAEDNTAKIEGAFQFGPLGATYEAKTGLVEWTVAPKAGSTAKSIAVVDAEGAKTSNLFNTYNGKIQSLVVNKIAQDAVGSESVYTVTHNGEVYTSASNASKTEYVDLGLQIMKNEQGIVYAVRVYASTNGQAISATDTARNLTVDALIRLDVSLEVFNTMTDAQKETFLTVVAPKLDPDATKEDYETEITDFVASEAEKEEAKKLNKYEQLYVGANVIDEATGERATTANGGKLISLFGAFNGDASADLEFGEWLNKLGGKNATFGNADQWVRRDGGVGYSVFYGMMEGGVFVKDSPYNNVYLNSTASTKKFGETRLNLGLELLPDEDFTIEYVAMYNPIYVADADGNIAYDADGNAEESFNYMKTTTVGQQGIAAYYTCAIDYIGFISSWTAMRDGIYSSQSPKRGDVIWMLTNKTPSWGTGTNWVGAPAFSGGKGLLASGIREYGKIHTYVYTRDESLRVNAEGTRVVDATYSVLRDAMLYTSQALSTENTKAGTEYFDEPDTGDFYLSSSLPTDFYAVRIYDTVLTSKEMAHNSFVDMMAYANFDLNQYFALNEVDRALIEGGMMSYGFESDPAKFLANFNELKAMYAEQVVAEDTLYVTKDLRVLTAAYGGLDTSALPIDGGIAWFNAARKGETITLKGTNWERRSDDKGAGYYILKDYAGIKAEPGFGIYLNEDMLPDANYTIEMILNPVGIVEFTEDGGYTRYIDEGTRYGINYDNGFAIGPLRCLIFPSASDGTPGRSQLEKRWVYDIKDYCWNQRPDDDGDGLIDRKQVFTEKAWMTTMMDDIVNFTLDYKIEEVDGSGNYTLSNDFTVIGKTTIAIDNIITNEEANNMFQMMVNMPHGVFSIRVYDRVLSTDEKLQNHAADVIYYYNLDTTLLDQIKGYFKDDPGVIFRGLSDLSFDMTKEEAQKTFDARLTALWLDFEGVSVRNDYTDGLRYYFGMDQSTATSMINAGFKIEIGAIVNVGQNTQPSLDGRNYDYKIVAFDSIAGKTEGFFIDSNTFAVTVKAGSNNKDLMLSNINVIGYVRLVDNEGKEIIFYVEPYADGYTPNSFFTIYSYMKDQKEKITDAALLDRFSKTADSCYERDYIYLDAAASAGGNGTKNAPYNNFEDAFAASKVKLAGINKPTYVYLQAADGVYEIHSIVSLDGAEIPYRYCRFIMTTETGNSTLTSTRKLDSSDFIEQEGNIWMYQFEADENGEYPFFRYLYANGKIAEMAHNGANSFYTADEYRYMTKFYRYDSGPWLNARYMWEAGQLAVDTLIYPAEKVALNSQFAYYRDQYLVYTEIYNVGTLNLRPNTESKVKETASTYYMQRFVEQKFNKLAFEELAALFTATKSQARDFVDALATYTSKWIKDGTSTPEYEARLREICDSVATEIIASGYKNNQVNPILAEYMFQNPTVSYPTISAVDDKTNLYVWPEMPSSGIYESVKAKFYAGLIDYDTEAPVADKGLAQEAQFYYYRDAFLALRDMEKLTDAELSFDVQPNAAGSEQYKELFYQYLYERMAILELGEAIEANKSGSTYLKAPISVYTTKYENAPALYEQILIYIRTQHTSNGAHDKTAGADGYIKFSDLSLYVPVVEEKDGPYEGCVPLVRSLDDYKAYLQVDLVGDQSMAIAQGRETLVEKGMALLAAAEEKYQTAYKALTDAIARYETLVAEGKTNEAKAYFDNVTGRRRDIVSAYETYLKEIGIAQRYLTDEYDEGFTLKGSGIEMIMPVEWQFNIVSLTGVDYDDKIVQDGVTYVAMYFEPSQWEQYAAMYEAHYRNRMHSLQQSYDYLDMQGEFYYNAEKGTIYYYSETGVADIDFEYPTLNNMMYFTNIDKTRVENWAFTGLDYTVISEVGGTWAQSANDSHINFEGVSDKTPSGSPIYIRRGTGFEVVGCNFHDLACSAINVRKRTSNILVEGNSFTDLGATAVHCGDATETDVTKYWPDEGQINVVITNNYMNRLAQIIYGANGIALTFNLDCEISYNTIKNTSYSAISVGYSWSFGKGTYEEMKNDLYWKVMHVNIHHNYIESFMQQLGDGGAIYTTGGNAIKEERKLFNYCHDNYMVFTNTTGDGEGRFVVALYYDGCTTNFESYNNVAVEASYGAAYVGDPYGTTTEEKMTDTFFATIDTPFTKAEYLRRLRNTHSHATYYYHQTLDSAQAYNITEHDSFIINCRSPQTGGTAKGTAFFEAFKNTVTSEDYIYIENMTYVKDPGRLPTRCQDIIYAAGCDNHKADAYDIANNNY